MTTRDACFVVATVVAILAGTTPAPGADDARFTKHEIATVPTGVDVERGIEFSPDALHVAYVGKSGGKSVPVVDAKPFDAQWYVHGPRWTADGRAGFVVVEEPKARTHVTWLMLDGKRVPGTDGVDSPAWSPDGTKLAFVADPECRIDADRSRPGPFFLFINGKKGAKWRSVFQLTWSPNSESVLAVAEAEKGGYCLLLDGKQLAKGARYDAPAFSPDGARVAYACELVKKGAIASDWTAIKWYVACGDLRLGLDFDGAGSPVFSPDGKRIAFKAERSAKVGISIDGKAPAFEWNFVSAPVFSPDGARIAFAASADCNVTPGYRVTSLPGAGLVTGGSWQLVVDGKASESKFDAVSALTFSPDGKRLAYRARTGDKWRVVCDGQASADFEFVGPPVLSPDGKRVAFGALRNRTFSWEVVDLP